MHIFRHERELSNPQALWRACAEATRSGSPLELLLAAARLECACSDAESGGEVDSCGRMALLRLSTQAAAFYLGTGPRPGRPTLAAAAAALPPPRTRLELAALEGIRFYALAPETYARAAAQWMRGEKSERSPVWVLGLRSMGSVLAPVVAAALRARGWSARLLTLRPAGAPQARELRLGTSLQAAWAQWRGKFLLVDEGPGLSGSSFGGAVGALATLGVGEERIALLAAWKPSPSQSARFANAHAAGHWRSWRVYAAPALEPPAIGPAREISAGSWRQAFGVHGRTPVWPQHERRKFLRRDGRVIAKFAGLGAWGRAGWQRAQVLAKAGWGPALAGRGDEQLEQGWVLYRRVPAAPLRRPGRSWCEHAGKYLAFVGAAFRAGEDQSPAETLQEMLRINLERLAGAAAPAAAPVGPRVLCDGHMLPWEWGETRTGFVKFDGTDHGDDPFFPGPADIAWDLAAVEVEFGGAHGAATLAAYCHASGEKPQRLAPRLAWHRLAYSAFRAAYCRFACEQTQAPDQARFDRLARRYQQRLVRYLRSPTVMTAAPGGAESWKVLGAVKG
ncbi:MAG: hypothetical protein ACRD04_10485 [Terriglobales bacterium]